MLSDSDASTHSAELVSCMNMDHYIIERYWSRFCSIIYIVRYCFDLRDGWT